jgi:hypothetical protein
MRSIFMAVLPFVSAYAAVKSADADVLERRGFGHGGFLHP